MDVNTDTMYDSRISRVYCSKTKPLWVVGVDALPQKMICVDDVHMFSNRGLPNKHKIIVLILDLATYLKNGS